MESPYARTGMEILSRRECLELLGNHRVGRLAYVVGDQPMVVPVNYGILSGMIVFRTGEGEKLAAAVPANVALEVDEIDAASKSGWSVVVRGRAEELSDASDWFGTSLRDADVPTWLPEAPDHIVLIRPTVISGRRLRPLPST